VAADEYTVRNAREYETGVAEYAAYNADRSVIAPYLDALCERVEPGARVLDLGCGPGWETGTLHARGYVAIGFDMSRAFLRYARAEHPGDRFVRGDMRRLPFADGAFGGVWACASMLHLASRDLDAALAEVGRVVAPGGGFVGSVQVGEREGLVPRKSAPGTELFYGYRLPEEWRGRVEAAGFVVEELVADVFEGEQPHLNEGSRGWATAIARRV
jgi:SAM-dependent methyltransferase